MRLPTPESPGMKIMASLVVAVSLSFAVHHLIVYMKVVGYL